MEIAYEYIAEHTKLLASSFRPFIECILIKKTLYESTAEKLLKNDYPKLREFHLVGPTRLKRFDAFYFRDTYELHTISFRNGIFGYAELYSYYEQTHSIRRIIFRNCSLCPTHSLNDILEEYENFLEEEKTVTVSWDTMDEERYTEKELQELEGSIARINQKESCLVFLDIGELIS